MSVNWKLMIAVFLGAMTVSSATLQAQGSWVTAGSPPPNDACADALLVDDGVIAFSTEGATTDGADEPERCTFWGYSHLDNDIWFDYTASCTGDLTISLCGSDYDTKLAVYAGCDSCLPPGWPLACDDDQNRVGCSLQSEVVIPTVVGGCYKIRVAGFAGATGAGVLTLRCEEPPPPTGACCDLVTGDCLGTMEQPECGALGGAWRVGADCDTFVCPLLPPPNDDCADCIPLLTDVPYSGSTHGSTGSDVTSCAADDTFDAWHCWTADCTGTATFSLCDSAYDTTLAVFDACDGTELACNDDQCLLQSRIGLLVTEGTTYFLRVSGFAGLVGLYTIVAESCEYACCLSIGFCGYATPEECAAEGGTPMPLETVCLGDLNGNRVDDACEPLCGNGIIEPGEECEGGDCCTDACTFDVQTMCRSSTGPCDPPETCDGTSDACPVDLRITDCIHSDGCCPEGAGCNANHDDDCPAACGNGILEPGEECDGADDAACPAECQDDCECPPIVPIPTASAWGLMILAILLLTGAKAFFGRRAAGRHANG